MFNKFINFFTHDEKQLKSDRYIFITILITALIGLLASLVLSVEALTLAKNPEASLSCNINELINCATVANSSFAQIFGFPNSFIGMMVEPVFAALAIAGLFGTKFTKQFMFLMQITAAISLVFAFYLLFVSSFIISAFCPWCLLVDVSTIIMFFAVTRYNVLHDNLYLSKKLSMNIKKFVQKDFDKLLAMLTIVLIAAGIILLYGSNLFT